MTAERTRAAVEAARRARAAAEAADGYVAADVLDELDRLRTLVRTPADGQSDPERVALLTILDGERHGIVDDALARRRHTITRIHEALGRLRACPGPRELLQAAPDELRATCGFTRVMVSRIQGSRWVPETLSLADPGYAPGGFGTYVEQADIDLSHLLLETEMVRRSRPALVLDPHADPRTYKSIILASQSTSYVAAPIIPSRRAIGFFHADRYGQDVHVTAEDRDNLWVFAEHFGLLFERAVLHERLQSMRVQLRSSLLAAADVIDQACAADIRLTRDEQPAPRQGSRRPLADPRIAKLTPRQVEVLALMAAGETNGEIARELVLTEGTVKTHVHHILRKLRASSRAEAVAMYIHSVVADGPR